MSADIAAGVPMCEVKGTGYIEEKDGTRTPIFLDGSIPLDQAQALVNKKLTNQTKEGDS